MYVHVFLAAQFFWQKGLKSKIITDIQYYKIAVGKYTREFSEIDNESTQILDVSKIFKIFILLNLKNYTSRYFKNTYRCN